MSIFAKEEECALDLLQGLAEREANPGKPRVECSDLEWLVSERLVAMGLLALDGLDLYITRAGLLHLALRG